MKKIKTSFDIIMYLLFVLLIEQYLLPRAVHEFMGASLLACFIVHNALNYRWYQRLFKGKYTLWCGIQTTANLLLLVSVTLCILSAFMISGIVFRFVRLEGMMVTGRKLHLVSTAWSFVLMSVHLGFHIHPPKQKPWAICFYTILSAAAVNGICQFAARRFYEELFLLTEFKWFDYDKSLIVYAFETVCISLCFALLTHLVCRLGIYLKEKKRNEKRI